MALNIISDIATIASFPISIVAVGIAVLSYRKALTGQLPAVELFPNFDYTRDRRYTIRIANPRRYSLYLEYIDVHEPKAANVTIRPTETSRRGDLERSWEGMNESHPQHPSIHRHPIYLCIPPHESRDLDVIFHDDLQEPIRFKFSWSGGLPWPDRWFIDNEIIASSERLKSMRLAADS
ncbi:MAG: hypothetical protein OXF88_20830 [Rhodobacteraceae bacterium]|nr:hypothetical protein [Paracoccaceae bacterium]MCY4137568.1 hypothetical protein [Paracoccaceae bacterium]